MKKLKLVFSNTIEKNSLKKVLNIYIYILHNSGRNVVLCSQGLYIFVFTDAGFHNILGEESRL